MNKHIIGALLALVVTAGIAACNPKGDEGPPNDAKPNGPLSVPSEPPKPPEGATGAAVDEGNKLVDELEREIDADVAAEDG